MRVHCCRKNYVENLPEQLSFDAKMMIESKQKNQKETERFFEKKFGHKLNHFVAKKEEEEEKQFSLPQQRGLRNVIFTKIFGYLGFKDLIHLSRVCKEFLEFSRSDSIWERFYKQIWEKSNRKLRKKEPQINSQNFFVNFWKIREYELETRSQLISYRNEPRRQKKFFFK